MNQKFRMKFLVECVKFFKVQHDLCMFSCESMPFLIKFVCFWLVFRFCISCFEIFNFMFAYFFMYFVIDFRKLVGFLSNCLETFMDSENLSWISHLCLGIFNNVSLWYIISVRNCMHAYEFLCMCMRFYNVLYDICLILKVSYVWVYLIMFCMVFAWLLLFFMCVYMIFLFFMLFVHWFYVSYSMKTRFRNTNHWNLITSWLTR